MQKRIISSLAGIMTVLSAGIVVLLLVALIAPGVALAHAELSSSSPASGQTVAEGLTTITLNFSEEISPDQSNAQLMHPDGSAVAGAMSAVDRANRKVETIQTPGLTAGKYMVKWHSVTEDDNGITDGSFIFTVAAASNASTTSTATTSNGAPLPATGSGQDSVLLAGLVAGALLLASLGLAVRRKMG